MRDLPPFPSPATSGALEGMAGAPGAPLPVLAGFVHGCSDDPAVRTAAATALVAGLWQLAGPGMTPRAPSLVLLNASGSEGDPIDAFAARLAADPGVDTGPRMQTEGPFMGGTPELAPVAMANALRNHRKAAGVPCRNDQYLAALKARYFAAQKTGFGRGLVRPYARAWHDVFGLLTDPGDRILLRLEDDGDRAAFRQHVIVDPDRLRGAEGYGAGLAVVRKNIAISGSLRPEHWDGRMAGAMLGLGLPILFLPHASGETPGLEIPRALDILAGLLPGAFHEPLEEPANLLPHPAFDRYGESLRARLRHLPGTYEYLMQRTARQLFVVCVRLADWAGSLSPPTPTPPTQTEIAAVALDLYGHALRGLVLGVAALAWHCHGFDPGISRARAAKALEHLRRKGPMGRSDLLRAAHLAREERDVLLERLAAEDLVRLDGKTVAAATFREFVQALYARDEFPEPKNHWAALGKDGGGSA